MTPEQENERLRARVKELEEREALRDAQHWGAPMTDSTSDHRITHIEYADPGDEQPSGYAGYEGSVNRDLVKKLVEQPERREFEAWAIVNESGQLRWAHPSKLNAAYFKHADERIVRCRVTIEEG